MTLIEQLRAIQWHAECLRVEKAERHPENVDKYARQREMCARRSAAMHKEYRRKILKQLLPIPQSSVDMAEQLGIARSSVYKTLVGLEEEGLAVRVGASKRTKWRLK